MNCQDGKGFRCSNQATVRLVAPDGQAIAGPGSCTGHADEATTEYADKLGEQWTTLLIT